MTTERHIKKIKNSQKLDEKQLQFLRQSAQLEEHIPTTAQNLNVILSVLVFAFIIWMAITPVEEFTQAPGEIVPTGFNQLIEHPDGGAIESILVQEGMLVKMGDPLITLDSIGVAEALRKAKITQQGLKEELAYAQNVLEAQQKLLNKGFSSHLDFLKLKQNVEKAKTQLSEQKETVDELQKRFAKLTIRAPIDGIVKELMVNTIGQVIKAGQPIMEIIPTEKKLVAEARVAPADMGYIQIGQTVRVKITAFDFYRFGYIEGRLIFVTPSTITDPSGEKYYRARIALSKNYVGKNKSHAVWPGMQIQASIITGEKSILAFLLKPIQRALETSFSEK